MTTPPLAVAAVLACAVAYRTPSRGQRIIARLLVGLTVVALVRPRLVAWLPVYVALFVGWYVAQTWAVWAVLKSESPDVPGRGSSPLDNLRRQASPSLLALAILASSALALCFDRAEDLARATIALSLSACTLASGRFAYRGEKPDAPQVVALVLAGSMLADAAGPWAFGDASGDWWLARWISVVTWTIVGGVNLWKLLRRRTES